MKQRRSPSFGERLGCSRSTSYESKADEISVRPIGFVDAASCGLAAASELAMANLPKDVSADRGPEGDEVNALDRRACCKRRRIRGASGSR
jgi:hypothetical protein